MSDGEITLADIQMQRADGKALAEMEQGMLGTPRRFVLLGYELYPNNTTSDPITDRATADEIGKLAGLGPTPDPAGFAIWVADGNLPWIALRASLEQDLANWEKADSPGPRLISNTLRNVLERMTHLETHRPQDDPDVTP